MKPAPFEIHQPKTVAEALELLARRGGDAKILAGGQSLVPLMNLRMAVPATLIDINRIAGLAGVRRDGDLICIGAMTRQKALLGDVLIAEHVPLLAKALAHVGHVQTRSRGTIGGSLVHADPAAEQPLVMVTLAATLTVESVRGRRTISARQFFRDALTTDLAPDEILIEIAVPVAPAGVRTAFREYARRNGDFAIAAAAVHWSPEDGTLLAALGGVATAPYFCARLACATASLLRDRQKRDSLVREEVEGLTPLSDLQADADYRRTLAALALADCLEEVMRS
jgi:CO/xanthine dehydrogenase FAD-binding subunit